MSKSTLSAPHIFGIRHHGPGSARSLVRALETLQPDVILVEGPPEADGLLPLIGHTEMQPPVAVLIYEPAHPSHAVFYPFAVFSPEWQALQFGLKHNIPIRFMDLPQAYQLALLPGQEQAEPVAESHHDEADQKQSVPLDPLQWLAEAAGYSDGERWWEHMVEHRQNDTDLFAAILEAMTALREQLPQAADPIGPQREAYMRQTLRAAQREGYQRIAVVCGAWHGPALAQLPPTQADTALLKSLAKVKVAATWTPWTYDRLAYASGYGAGIQSPGWYHHLWTTRQNVTVRWITKAARLLRQEDLDASSAHIIEAVRLADTLAALRDQSLPGLPELNEAIQSVFCFGSDLPLRLIHDKLIVGQTLGHIPSDTPVPPLQQDLQREQKRLRLPPEGSPRTLDLDLRQPLDLDRSRLLHRLGLLKIPWGKLQRIGKVKGTFHEVWQILWKPEFAVNVIEAGMWGNTVFEAATAHTIDAAQHAIDLSTLAILIDQTLLADLPQAVEPISDRIQTEAALASDTTQLMAALPPLINVLRYGNVRQTDIQSVGHIVDGLIARITIGLPMACASLNDEAASAMFNHLTNVHQALALLQNENYTTLWQTVLRHLADQKTLHGLIAGRACRLLLDQFQFTAVEAAQRMSLSLSLANEPAQSAAWLDGFLRGSGLLLLHDETLWQVTDEWLTTLAPDAFTQLLPLLRRTFSTFPAPERRQMGEKVKRAPKATTPSPQAIAHLQSDEFDADRAAKVLPLLMKILDLEQK